MDKRGLQSFNYLLWIVRIVYLIIVLTSIVLLVRIYSITIVNSETIESNLFVQRLLYAPHGISYYDEELQRVYPGIVDASKIDGTYLTNIIFYKEENKYISAKISLYAAEEFSKTISKQSELETKLRLLEPLVEATYNEVWYNRWLPRAQSGASGKGGAQKFVKLYPVTLKKDEEMLKAYLVITVVLPNA